MIKLKTINNEVVLPMQTPDDEDKRAPRGVEMVSAPYANIYVCAKKQTGKTNIVAKCAMKFVGPETSVHIFCSTVYTDPKYIELGKYFDKHDIAYYPSTSIYDDDGNDLLADILKIDEDFLDNGKAEDDDPKPKIHLLDLDPKPKERKKKKSKFKELRRLFIFDDLSNEIRRSKSLIKLLKINRHLKCKCIVASQWLKDLDPQCINQLDYVFLLKFHNEEKLEDLREKLDLSIPLDLFLFMYKYVTRNKNEFNFLYITRFESYRMNFNKQIIIDSD